jgi:hypothetical protein
MDFEKIPTAEQSPKNWEQRIIDNTKNLLEAEVLQKVNGLKLNEELKNEVLTAINEKLNNDEFIQSRSETGNWEKKLASTENPEEEESNLSQGLAIKIKQDLSNEGFKKIFG